MPIAHFSVTARLNTHQQSAVDAVHYLTRQGAWQAKGARREERDVGYLTRDTPSTKTRNDLVACGTQHLPAWAEGEAATFFHEAAQWERAGGRYAYVIQMSLPRSLTHAQHLALTEDFLLATMPDKPLLWVKHEPVALDGQPNPHVHIMLSARNVDGILRSPQQTFARYNRLSPAAGGCLKDRFWNERTAVSQLRASYADLSNFHFERAGVAEWIDPRSLWQQGIDRPSLGKGSRGTRLERDVAAEQARAQAAWEARKRHKGLDAVQDIPREEMVLLVRQWTREKAPGQALPRSSAAEVATWETAQLSRHQTALAGAQREEEAFTQYGQRLHGALLRERDYPRTGTRGSATADQHVEALLAQGQALGLGVEEEPGQGLLVPLERKRRQGYGR